MNAFIGLLMWPAVDEPAPVIDDPWLTLPAVRHRTAAAEAEDDDVTGALTHVLWLWLLLVLLPPLQRTILVADCCCERSIHGKYFMVFILVFK